MDIQFIEVYQDFIKSLGLSPAEYNGQDAKMIAVVKREAEMDMFTDHSMDFTISSESGEQI